MKKLFLLYLKDIHFTFNDCVYLQNDGVPMGLSLGPVLTDIIMVQLETEVFPTITNIMNYIVNCKCFVNDTIPFVKINMCTRQS